MISEDDFLALPHQAQKNLTGIVEYISIVNMGQSALVEDLENPANTTAEVLTGEKFVELLDAMDDVHNKYGKILARIRANSVTPPTDAH